jgi:hypothetical protein
MLVGSRSSAAASTTNCECRPMATVGEPLTLDASELNRKDLLAGRTRIAQHLWGIRTG